MGESEILTRDECRRLFDIAWSAARLSGASELEMLAGAHSLSLTRFAENSIHQNVSERRRHISIRAVVDRRTARASTNRLDEDGIRGAAERAVALAKAREPDPELLPVAAASEYRDVDRFCPSTAQLTPAERADAVAGVVAAAAEASQTAAGIYSTSEAVEALVNSRGAFAYYFDTNATFSVTMMRPGSSGWAKQSALDCDVIDPLALARRASQKAAASERPREIAPGRYTVILEPPAVQDLLGQMFPDFSATAIRDRRSFLNERVGQKVFGDNINIVDDVYHPMQSGPPFDGEGVPRRILTLVRNGVVRDVPYSRLAASRTGVEPTGHGFPVPNDMGEAPENIVFSGGTSSLDEMIASTQRGILLTRVWYIREVDPYEKIMTGLTRDGTFLVEDGRIVAGLRNLRFNQGLIEMLNRVEDMTPAERASGEESIDMVVPAMKVAGFNFTEVTPP